MEIQRKREDRSRWSPDTNLLGRLQLVVRRCNRGSRGVHVQIRKIRVRRRRRRPRPPKPAFERQERNGAVWIRYQRNREKEDEEKSVKNSPELLLVFHFLRFVRMQLHRDGMGQHGGDGVEQPLWFFSSGLRLEKLMIYQER